MSDLLKIAFVVEGKTDYIMLKKILEKLLGDRDFVPSSLQPEMSEAFQMVLGEDGGWPGVCRWCLQSAEQGGGRLSDNPLFSNYHLLILQLDADVADASYSEGHIEDHFSIQTIPFVAPCPPASATTNKLRNIVLLWIGEQNTPSNIVFCIPSKELETWIVVGLFPDDRVARSSGIECRREPKRILQGKPKERRLVSSGKAKVNMYEKFAPEFADNWSTVKARCVEAARFETDFLNALARI
jgi:hypothetical protein